MKNADTPASESTEDSLKSRASIGQAGFYRMPANALTKREKAAFRAMQGICVNAGRNGHSFDRPEVIAEDACKIADALLAELEKK